MMALPNLLKKKLKSVKKGVERAYFSGITEIEPGLEIHVDPSNGFELSMARSRYENMEIRFFSDIIETGEYCHFADIGGCTGVYSLIFKNRTDGIVEVFEPVPWHAARIKQNALLNNFEGIEVYEMALDNESGSSELVLSPDLSIEASITGSTFSSNESRSITVKTDTLDSFYYDKPRPEIIKIDVEGNERSVIQGGTDALADRPPIFIELHQSLYDDRYEELQKIGEILQQIGYEEFYHLEENVYNGLDRLSSLEAFTGEPTHLFIK